MKTDQFKLQLEIREGAIVDVQPLEPHGILVTPAISKEFWLLRVKVSDRQAIVGFPKFTTLGIGFAIETDWNTNLPYSEPAEKIYAHIAHNKADKAVPKARCIAAIEMIQAAWAQLHERKENGAAAEATAP